MARWRRKPIAPKGYQPWPADAEGLTVDRLVKMYESGFGATIYQPEEREALFSSMPFPDGEATATQFGLAESGAGKLSLPFLFAYRHWPRVWPSPAQTTGSCVSKAGKNAAIVLIGVEAELGDPDPQTGIVEGYPEISSEAEVQGVVASEPSYGYRGHRGQGASCSRLIQYFTAAGGVHLRKNYSEIGIDLTRANDSLGAGWGGSGTPAALNEIGKKHQIRNASDCPTSDVCRDFLANGYPIWACSSYGWSSSRDENGYSPRRGSWSHSWIIMGYDDRDIIKQKYGGALALYCHDWGRWNSGGRRILGTDIDIPEGCMWIDAKLLDNCDCTAMSNLNGFPRRNLPDFGFSLAG